MASNRAPCLHAGRTLLPGLPLADGTSNSSQRGLPAERGEGFALAIGVYVVSLKCIPVPRQKIIVYFCTMYE